MRVDARAVRSLQKDCCEAKLQKILENSKIKVCGLYFTRSALSLVWQHAEAAEGLRAQGDVLFAILTYIY